MALQLHYGNRLHLRLTRWLSAHIRWRTTAAVFLQLLATRIYLHSKWSDAFILDASVKLSLDLQTLQGIQQQIIQHCDAILHTQQTKIRYAPALTETKG